MLRNFSRRAGPSNARPDPALPPGALSDDELLLRLMRVKLRAVREEGELHYVGWRYHEYFLEQPDEAFFPWALAYFYTDDTDAAIDVAEAWALRQSR